MLLGNICQDVDIRHTAKGTAVATINLATNRTRIGDNGEKIEEATFTEVTLWGRTAEVIAEYSGKGHKVFVEGRLQLDKWQDKETGVERTKLKVVADNVTMVSSKGEGTPRNQSPASPPEQQAAPQHPAPQQNTLAGREPIRTTPSSGVQLQDVSGVESQDGIPF